MEISDPRVHPSLVPAGSRAVVIAEHQEEYRDLPSVRTPGGQVITRWTPTDEERRAILAGEDKEPSARSDAWIVTEDNNRSDPTSFFRIGPEQSVALAPKEEPPDVPWHHRAGAGVAGPPLRESKRGEE